jgi:hypothetical protein
VNERFPTVGIIGAGQLDDIGAGQVNYIAAGGGSVTDIIIIDGSGQ